MVCWRASRSGRGVALTSSGSSSRMRVASTRAVIASPAGSRGGTGSRPPDPGRLPSGWRRERVEPTRWPRHPRPWTGVESMAAAPDDRWCCRRPRAQPPLVRCRGSRRPRKYRRERWTAGAWGDSLPTAVGLGLAESGVQLGPGEVAPLKGGSHDPDSSCELGGIVGCPERCLPLVLGQCLCCATHGSHFAPRNLHLSIGRGRVSHHLERHLTMEDVAPAWEGRSYRAAG